MEFRIADTFTASLDKLTNDEQKAVKTTASCPGSGPTSKLAVHRDLRQLSELVIGRSPRLSGPDMSECTSPPPIASTSLHSPLPAYAARR